MMRFDKAQTQLGRLHFLQFLSAVLMLFLGIAIFWRQWLNFQTFNLLNEKQCLRRILYPGPRGKIYDRNGNVLADNRSSYCLYVDLNYFRKPLGQFSNKQTTDAEKAEQLWALVHDALLPFSKQTGPIPFTLTKKAIYRHYQQNILLPLAIAKDLPDKLYAMLVETLPSNSPFYVGVEKVRHYPYGSSACHVLGYVNQTPELSQDSLPGNDLRTFFLPKAKGRTGVEAYYDSTLSGFNGGDIWRVTPAGQEQNRLLSIPSIPGEDLHLTLDIELQQVCENALNNRRGAVVILDVKTDEVLALVSKPDFDLNGLTPRISNRLFKQITESGAWLNRALQGLYPPGSAFKIVSLAAMLKNGIIDQNSSVKCEGSYRIGNRTFHCHKRYGHGYVNLKKAIQTSCNPFIYHYALLCGPEPIYNEARIFHFQDATGIDLPYETHNMLVPSSAWKEKKLGEKWMAGDTANFAIGQGFLRVTPLQMACFISSFAQNKTQVFPHLVKHENPSIYTHKQALPPHDWKLLLQGMEASAEQGTAHLASIANVKSALKTGTAQIKISGTQRYMHIGWLVGFAPSQNPQIAFCVMVEQDDEQENFWGSHVCGPITKDFLQYYFSQETR